MKILAIVQTIDMKYRLGTTPAWWGLMKALNQEGNEVVLSAYLGAPIETPWWDILPNPCELESMIFNYYLNKSGKREVGSRKNIISKLSGVMIDGYVKPKWKKFLLQAVENEKPDAVFITTIPLNHISGIASEIRAKFNIPVIFYDGDLPMSLPDYTAEGAFKFSMYDGNVDLGEYDLFLSCSRGVLTRLSEMGAKNVSCLYYATDTDVFKPIALDKEYDVFYYGHRSRGKEEQMDWMIKEPSLEMPNKKFLVAGQEYNANMGNAICMKSMSLPKWNIYCCKSKVNLNITKNIDRKTPMSSSARPFELAAMGCCMVSDAYLGIEEWFEECKEIIIVHNKEQAIKTYERLLEDKSGFREYMGNCARQRVLDEHTWRHRARKLIKLIRSL